MARTGMLMLALAALPVACGSGQASRSNGMLPGTYAAATGTATAVRDTPPTDTTRAEATGRSAQPAESAGAPAATASGGMTGGRGGMMGGRMGMMGGSGAQAPTATARVAADTGACPQITQALTDEGRQIFTGQGNCATCHGASGKGGPLAPDLTDTTWLDTNGSYAGIDSLVQAGVPQPKQHPAPMPPMGGARLSARQVCAVAGYVYSLSHKK